MTAESKLVDAARQIEEAARVIGEARKAMEEAREELISDAMARAGKYAVEDLANVLGGDTINHDIGVALQIAGLGDFLDYVQQRGPRAGAAWRETIFTSLEAHYASKVDSGVLRPRSGAPSEGLIPPKGHVFRDPIEAARSIKPV
jgi:hypothetical protein